ncbi:universal stress protein [Halosegnis rubeus]|jgi:nucleotide-binding universal stress UspA family protein|uniref:Universal stress protein n=1 Tax=Halosegnis rubeus TaxID=2212850 RepID=A0A5N5UBC1_9EURY|nr:universal stress protein [Halosegnis rubeus]KAB7515878.1 universal stress protein [Halosegnis rubeus]KAB7516907.1 universal stress protein [Halosegnis rubeus]KAB7519964.1 universal stress protein [Halosegnis rubeus]
MTTFLAGVDSEETAEHLLAYLRGRIDDDDTVYAVNSQRGGDDTSDDEVAAGKSALEPLEEELGADGHQLVRGNSPQEDMIQFARDHDVDELVIAIRKRSPTGKMLFGSTAQDLLLETDRPVVTVPRQR